MITNDATYISGTRTDGNDYGHTLYYSDGSQNWPGYIGMPLRRGYWIGTHEHHTYIGRRSEAAEYCRTLHIEVLANHPLSRI